MGISGGGAAVNCRPSAIFENASRKKLFARCGLSKASFPKLPLLLNVQEIVLETEGGQRSMAFLPMTCLGGRRNRKGRLNPSPGPDSLETLYRQRLQ